jgi:acyl-CoA thioesterase-1
MFAEKTGFGPKASLRTRFGALLGLGLALVGAIGAGATAEAGARSLPEAAGQGAAVRTMVFFGDSLTAGFGLANPGMEAFPAVIQRKIDAARRPWRVVNAGLSGETSSGGLRRVDWVLRQAPDMFVLALGANDGLRGIEPGVTRANLARIIARVREKNPAVVILLTGMQMPPNLGPDYTRDFATLYPDVAKTRGAVLVPFLLEGVGGEPELNQADGIHPTAEGHRKIADTVWAHLLPLL